MELYNNDKIYPDNILLKEIKDIIYPTILEKIKIDNITKPGLSENCLADIIYSQIMSLGYNNQDINLAVVDLLPNRNSTIYNSSEEIDAINMAIDLSVICKSFTPQIRAFIAFHKMTKDLIPQKEIIRNVKMLMLSPI